MFSSSHFKEFVASWGVLLRFWCAYMQTGNGIIKQCHHSVKQIAVRMGFSIQEAMYWYNVASKYDTSLLTAPASGIYKYEVRIRGVDPVPTSLALALSKYHLGDFVWVKQPCYWCTSEFWERQITEVISPQYVVVNEVPRHIEDLWPQTNITLTSKADGD